MLNPLTLPVELIQRINAIADAVERLPAIEKRLAGFEETMDSMPQDIERELRPHMERQAETAEEMAGRLANLDDRIPGGNKRGEG